MIFSRVRFTRIYLQNMNSKISLALHEPRNRLVAQYDILISIEHYIFFFAAGHMKIAVGKHELNSVHISCFTIFGILLVGPVCGGHTE